MPEDATWYEALVATPMLTDAQRETWRKWRQAVDLIADEGLRIDQHPKLTDALEAWAIAYAEASS